MKVNIKENSADIVRTVDRAGLMADRFKDISMRTRDDLVEIFNQDDGQYEYAPDAMETAMTDSGSYAMRTGVEMIQYSRGTYQSGQAQSDEYFHQNATEFGNSGFAGAESDEYFQHRAKEYVRNRAEKAINDRRMADHELIQDAEGQRNNVLADNRLLIRRGQKNTAGNTDLPDGVSSKERLIQQRKKEYAINKLKKHSNNTRISVFSRQESRTGNRVTDGAKRVLRRIAQDAKTMLTTYSAVGAILLMVVVITILFSATFMTVGDEEGNNFAYDFYEIGPGYTAIVKVAQAQLGNVGGNKFWKWYGFSSHVHWCACFVSWCGDQCGYVKAGIIPKYAVVGNGASWFKERHRWASRGYSPKPGDIIFFDFERDGVLDHTGIVESCDGKTVTTIEGNSGNACKRQSYVRGSSQIAGYGIPAFNLAPKRDSNEKKKETE